MNRILIAATWLVFAGVASVVGEPDAKGGGSLEVEGVSTEEVPDSTAAKEGVEVLEEMIDWEPALKDGFDWLMSQQGADGGWHSSTYGSMKGGAALTSLVLYTASVVPEKVVEPHADALRRGWTFLAPGLRGAGKVSAPDGESDYPTYATGLLLSALNRLDLGQSPEDVEALAAFLCRVQLGEDDGFDSGDLDFGGWDLMGDEKREGATMGTNISVSRFVLEGLDPHRKRDDVKTSFADAKKWVVGLQNFDADGGFFFHPDGAHLGNKAGWSDPEQKKPRSYGTCTADGLLALAILAAGDGDEQIAERMKAASGWLERESGVAEVPGFTFDPPEKGWESGLRLYYMMALSAALPILPEEMAVGRRRDIRGILVRERKEDGGWVNASARMREDDPIIATCFALAALGRLADW